MMLLSYIILQAAPASNSGSSLLVVLIVIGAVVSIKLVLDSGKKRKQFVYDEFSKKIRELSDKNKALKSELDETKKNLDRQIKDNLELQRKLSDHNKYYDILKEKYLHLDEQARQIKDNITMPEFTSYRRTGQKLCALDIIKMKDEILSWMKDGTKYYLVLKQRFIDGVDYEPKCNYVNVGYRYPDLICEKSPCCTVVFGDAYIQTDAPKNGIVYYEENSSLNSGDTILYIETDALAIEEFEKGKIKERLLQKKKKRELEKIAMQELIDEGMFFPESSKRPPIPKEVADAVWNRDGGKCVYCGSTENLQFDHIIPFSKGGATTVENLQLLCQKCNLEKSNKIG